MKRRELISLLGCAALAAAPGFARAQQQGRVPRVAVLLTDLPSNLFVRHAVDGLREFGYTDSTTVVIEYFSAPTIADLPQYAARAVAAKPDVIVSIATPASLAAKSLTATIPIVFVMVGAPEEIGLVASLSRPGGNITGVSSIANQLEAKRLHMLHEIRPGLSRVAVFVPPQELNDPNTAVSLPGIIAASKTLGIEVFMVEAKLGADLGPSFAFAATNGAQAVHFVSPAYFGSFVGRIAALATQHRLPTMFGTRQLPDAGGLVSYSANLPALYRRSAYHVDRILRGAKPSDLPVELPTKFEMVINLKTAKALGLEIPLLVLAQADEVIE